MINKYSEEELDIVNAIEDGEFKSVNNLEKEKKMYSQYAANTLRKDKRVNIRISERDLQSIQRKALEEGIPYQTLISSLLHKYINGRLVESK
ncbi:MAG: antitoxin [Spirochaetia bacterium]|nr:antitoxin [Spirochaetia bacterium]